MHTLFGASISVPLLFVLNTLCLRESRADLTQHGVKLLNHSRLVPCSVQDPGPAYLTCGLACWGQHGVKHYRQSSALLLRSARP